MSTLEPISRKADNFGRSQSHDIRNFNSVGNEHQIARKFEEKRRTLGSSILDYQKGAGNQTARTNYAEGRYQNPENDYKLLIKQNGKSIYVKQKQLSLPKKGKSKYDAVNIYSDLAQKDATNVGGQCVLQNTQKQILRKLVAMSIKHHDPTLCVCAYCTCGRHLCRIHPWKPPGVKPLSIYKKDYTKKNPYEDLKFRPSSSFKDNGPGVDPLSTYTKDYPPKQSQIDPKFLPQDLLRTGGPFLGLTTYGTGFPGYKIPMCQSLKPVGGEVVHGFPFNGNSNYRKNYTAKQPSPLDPFKTHGNLKLGQPWIGSTTYRDNFLKPNSTYANGWQSKLSNIPDPKYANQFDTTYRNDFIPLGSTICPAIPQLLSRSKFYSASKNSQMMKQSRRALSKAKGTS